jgi:NADH dehydrogenase FAD-containing subunit
MGRGPPPGRSGPQESELRPSGASQDSSDSLRALRVRPRYTLLDERDGFYHTVGAPLGQISPSYAREFWIKYENIISDTFVDEDVQFVHGSAVALDTTSKIVKYSNAGSEPQNIAYDYLIVATGMRRGTPVVPKALEKSTFLTEVNIMSTELKKSSRVVVVGGGKLTQQIPKSTLTIVPRRCGHRNGSKDQARI